ncbi:hypothetical protein D3C87_197830 [compost metagenome]
MLKFSHYFNEFPFWLYIYEKHTMEIARYAVFLQILFILFSCSSEDGDKTGPALPQSITLNGKQQRDTVFLYFDIPEKTIRAQRSGKLERLVEDPAFKKNNLLVQFDDYDAFVELSGEKEALKEDLVNYLSNLPKNLQPVEKKWRDFSNKLTPDKLIPAFPPVEFKEEAAFLDELRIREKYEAIHKKELGIQNYFQLGTEDGFITKAHAHTDEYVKKNKPLLSYHPKKIKVTAEASFPFSKSIRKQITTDLLVRMPVEQAKPIQTSSSKDVYQLTLNQKLDPQICPEYVIINQDQHVFRIPKEFVGKDQKAAILKENGIVKQMVYYKNGEYFVYSKKKSIRVQRP